jgi:hypothetical protein
MSRSCTCHPDDNPPVPCAQMYALSECRAAVSISKYEVGVVTAHPIVMMWRAAMGIWRTWMYARSIGIPATHWYGVYEAGSEVVMAHCGALPGAQQRATRIAKMLEE